ncbi:MAG: 23S rRNA (guanosine(2251)-2'-O)-methyltransferase RlmB, partial [Myxococcota bacterium]
GGRFGGRGGGPERGGRDGGARGGRPPRMNPARAPVGAPRRETEPRGERRGGEHGEPRGPRTPAFKRAESENLIYGLRSVATLLKADPQRVKRVVVETDRDDAETQAILEQAKDAGIRVQRVRRDELAALTRGSVHQGVVAEVAPFSFVSWEELLTEDKPALLLVLDEVTDPQNVGAAARAAWALGGTGMIIPKDRSASVTAAAEKVASGALAYLKVAQVTNLARTLEELKERGVWIIGLADDGDVPVWRQDLTDAVALVVGSEGTGMRRLTRELCDAVVSIPMAQAGAALNAADAAAVALYEVSRQRATKE